MSKPEIEFVQPEDRALVDARRVVFPEAWRPPSTLLVVAGFVLPDALIEVEAIAALPAHPAVDV